MGFIGADGVASNADRSSPVSRALAGHVATALKVETEGERAAGQTSGGEFEEAPGGSAITARDASRFEPSTRQCRRWQVLGVKLRDGRFVARRRAGRGPLEEFADFCSG